MYVHQWQRSQVIITNMTTSSKSVRKKRLSYEYIYRNALSTCTEHAAHPGVFLSALPSFNVNNGNYYYSSYTLSDPDNPSKLSHLDKVFVLGSN